MSFEAENGEKDDNHNCDEDKKDEIVPNNSDDLNNKCKVTSEDESNKEVNKEDEVSDEESSSSDLLSMLIKAAKLVNPVQFNLPFDYAPSISFPGSSKRSSYNSTSNNYRSKKQPHELDNGIVPLPVKVCFKCGRSCRKAPLIQCDFCPLLYHADCLDPPLTCLPSTRWMCPNHVEHILEEKFLFSPSLSERIKLWKKCRSKVSDEVVKLDFLKKVHQKNPPYRCKVKTISDNIVQVPDAIKEMYKNPPPLFMYRRKNHCTSLKEDKLQPRCQNFINSENQSSFKPSPEEQEEWLKLLDNINLNDINYHDINKLDEKLVRYLAYQRIQELISSKNGSSQSSSSSVSSSSLSSSLSLSLFPNRETNNLKLIKIRARAVLRPISSKECKDEIKNLIFSSSLGPEVLMSYRSLSIGVGANNDLKLTDYGHCNYVSTNHACIYFDEVCFN